VTSSPGRLTLKAAGKLGLAPRLLAPNRGQPIILMYHGVAASSDGGLLTAGGDKHVSESLFREHLRLLAARRRVVPLSTLVGGLLARKDCRGMVALSFDDGYLNNAQCAAPILREHSMSATFFLASGFIGANRWAWTDRLEYVMARSPGLAESRRELLLLTKAKLKALDWKLAEERVAEIAVQSGVPDAAPHGRYRFMSWDDARALVRQGFEVGAHTVNHAILSRVPLAEATREILDSQARVKAETGTCSSTFCYPNGRRTDYTGEVMDVCRQHFDAALSAEAGAARIEDRFEIRRIGVDDGTSPARLAARILQGA
jgi:peptidoglycan/xylan/chitin deacetylase (PgdA/CDA1 family)